MFSVVSRDHIYWLKEWNIFLMTMMMNQCVCVCVCVCLCVYIMYVRVCPRCV